MRYGRQDDGIREKRRKRQREREKVRKREAERSVGEKRDRSGRGSGPERRRRSRESTGCWHGLFGQWSWLAFPEPKRREENRKEAEGKGQETEREMPLWQPAASSHAGNRCACRIYPVRTVLYCPVRVLQSHSPSVVFYPNFILIICWYKIGDLRSLSFLSFSPRSIFPPSPRLPVSLSNRPASGHIRFYRAAADWPPGPEPVTDPRIRSSFLTVPYRMFVPCRGPPAGCYLQVHLTVETTAVVGENVLYPALV